MHINRESLLQTQALPTAGAAASVAADAATASSSIVLGGADGNRKSDSGTESESPSKGKREIRVRTNTPPLPQHGAKSINASPQNQGLPLTPLLPKRGAQAASELARSETVGRVACFFDFSDVPVLSEEGRMRAAILLGNALSAIFNRLPSNAVKTHEEADTWKDFQQSRSCTSCVTLSQVTLLLSRFVEDLKDSWLRESWTEGMRSTWLAEMAQVSVHI